MKVETYLVFVRAYASNTSDPNSTVLMSYCGYARLMNETDCSNGQLLCSIPGPMFYVPVKREINVVWINDINGTGLNWDEVDFNCYMNISNDRECTVNAKPDAISEDCTYYDPTQLDYKAVKQVRISSELVPISPHVHGV